MLLYFGGCLLKRTHLDSLHMFRYIHPLSLLQPLMSLHHACHWNVFCRWCVTFRGRLSSNLWTCGHVVSIQPCELQTFGQASLLVMLPQGHAEQSGFFFFTQFDPCEVVFGFTEGGLRSLLLSFSFLPEADTDHYYRTVGIWNM